MREVDIDFAAMKISVFKYNPKFDIDDMYICYIYIYIYSCFSTAQLI